MQPVNRVARQFNSLRTETIVKAGNDRRWLKWLAESKLLRDCFLDGLPLDYFWAECRATATVARYKLTVEESRFVYGPRWAD